jgi:isopentenyl diphosphate isomerase/L-lactate dehydrogenase-like FMN-dependent dehydrogenase
MDGGVRRGTDVVKALCLGATAVMIARPYLWGLAVGGERGVADVLALLRAEVERTLALLGRPTISALERSAIGPSPEALGSDS